MFLVLYFLENVVSMIAIVLFLAADCEEITMIASASSFLQHSDRGSHESRGKILRKWARQLFE